MGLKKNFCGCNTLLRIGDTVELLKPHFTGERSAVVVGFEQRKIKVRFENGATMLVNQNDLYDGVDGLMEEQDETED